MSPPPPASVALDLPLDAVAAPPALAEEARLRRQAFAAVLASALFIGFSPIFVRLADVGPAAIGFWRLVFALGPMALWAWAEVRTARLRRPQAGAHARVRNVGAGQFGLAALAGFFFAADLVMFHAGLARTGTANGVLLGNLAPVFILLLAWPLLGERPTLALTAALVMALAGSAAIIVESSTGGGPASGMLGDLLCVGAALCYAAYMLVVRYMRRGGPGVAGLGGGMVSFLSTAAGAVFCLIWAVGTGETLVPASLQGILAVAGLGVVTHAAGQGLTTFALGRLPAGLISVVLLLQILVGVSLAALLFGEMPSAVVLFGGALIVAGVVAVRPR